MFGTIVLEQSRSRGPAQRLARKIARKQRMIEEYERIAGEADLGTSRGRETQDYLLKRAADFRDEKSRLETELQAVAARSRRARNGRLHPEPSSGSRFSEGPPTANNYSQLSRV
jgi:hypothetical protein